MYFGREKIVKKKGENPTDLEDEVAKAFFELENVQIEGGAEDIKKIKFCKAEEISEGDNKVLLISIPFPLYPYVKRKHSIIMTHMSNKFKKPVFIIAKRTILSKYGIKNSINSLEKRKGSQKRPMNRTLTSVHDSYLDDIVYI